MSEEAFMQLPGDWAKPLALLHCVVLSDSEAANARGLSPLNAEELKRKAIETPLPAIVTQRRNSALNIRSFRETRIEGTVRSSGNSILVLQTPFDPGWHASVDGRSAPTFEVDVGLLGVALDDGEHDLKMFYRPPFLYAGAATTLLALGLLFWSVLKWPRIRLDL
jgi:hypothetical protein